MDSATKPPLTIENGNWGGVSLRAIRVVLESAFDVLLDAFGKLPDAPVHVARWSQDPRVFYDYRPYQIRISAHDTYWCQYVYQFSHELCHVMTNFDRCKEHKHNWFEESLCELASLFVLHRLAAVWKSSPPDEIIDSVTYAPNFKSYAEDTAAKYPRVCSGDSQKWLSKNIDFLEANSCERKLNGTLAVLLLDRFLRDPSLWRDCGWLNHWDSGVNATFREYLDSWAAQLHENDYDVRAPELIGKLLYGVGNLEPQAPNEDSVLQV